MRQLSMILNAIALSVVLVPPALADGDLAAGKKIFKKCAVCHSLTAGKNKVGPSLHGVFGRTSGTAPKYKYSKAMKAKGVVWDNKTLNTYLTAPKKFVPGNKMPFPGLKKAEQRADLLAYLEQASK